MNPEELMCLLTEASQKNCSQKRRVEILSFLLAPLADDVEEENNEVYRYWRLYISDLYNDMVNNRPNLLPALYPAFAKLCGPRKNGSFTAPINFSPMPK